MESRRRTEKAGDRTVDERADGRCGSGTEKAGALRDRSSGTSFGGLKEKMKGECLGARFSCDWLLYWNGHVRSKEVACILEGGVEQPSH